MSLPLPTDPPVSVRLFKRVACFRLMHHRDDCRWQLSPRWRAVLRGEYLETTATLSQELRAFADEMDELDATRGRDRAEEMREKTRMLGRPAPMQAALLPMSRSRHRQATSQEGTA